jgi:hypothetical protein
MARQSNQRNQLMSKFKRALSRLAPAYSLVDSSLSDGSPAIEIKSGSTVLMYAAIQQRSYSGFQVVAELSSSAAEGTPEHALLLAIDSDAGANTADVVALISAIAAKVGCSEFKVYTSTSTPSSSILVDANLKQTIPNDPELGSVGA